MCITFAVIKQKYTNLFVCFVTASGPQGLCVVLLLVPGWFELEVIKEVEATGHCLHVTLKMTGSLWAPPFLASC